MSFGIVKVNKIYNDDNDDDDDDLIIKDAFDLHNKKFTIPLFM